MASNIKLGNLEDFDDTDLGNHYIIMYDKATDSFKSVNPDVLLSKSVIDDSLPDDFIDVISSNVIRGFDGGEFG
tara:strand:+ start:16 stop:237 length:222 start_codon:yes stop_codon:yes gene_type:complete